LHFPTAPIIPNPRLNYLSNATLQRLSSNVIGYTGLLLLVYATNTTT
jgi:hypothetical protein